MYLQSMIMVGTLSAPVLNPNITIINDKFQVSVFDKTDNFSFDVVKYPSSNTPDNLLYNVYYSQALQFLYICSDSISF